MISYKEFVSLTVKKAISKIAHQIVFPLARKHQFVEILLETCFKILLITFRPRTRDTYKPIPQKVIFVIGTLGGGGAEKQLVLLAKQMKLFGWTPVVVVNRLDQPEQRVHLQELINYDIKVVPLNEFAALGLKPKNIKRKTRMFTEAIKLAEVIKVEHPSVVHAWMDHANCQALLAGEIVQIPRTILGFRSLSPNNLPLWLPSFRPIYQKFHRAEVTFVANSEKGAQTYSNWLAVNEVVVIPNGFKLDNTADVVAKESMKSGPTMNVIGCLRLSWEKGPDLWMEVATKVCQKTEGVVFHLFGEGPLRLELERLVKSLNLEDRIVFYGFKDNPWKCHRYDIHLSTSRIEGMPNVAIEATMSGITTVAFDVGGISEVLGHGSSCLVNPFDTDAMVNLIIDLLAAPEKRKTFVNYAQSRVKEYLDIELITKQYIAAYGTS